MQSRLSVPSRRFVQQPQTRSERTMFEFGAILLLVCVLFFVSSVIVWQFWHTNRIFTGVTVAGVPVGGLTRAAALGRLSQQVQNYALPAVSVAYNGQQWPLTNAQIRAQANLLDTLNQAYQIGRQGNMASRLIEQIIGLLGGKNLTPELTFDAPTLRNALSQIASQVRRPGRPARQIGDVQIPAQPGVDVDVEQTLQNLLAALQSSATQPAVQIPLAAADLAPPDVTATSGQTADAALTALSPPLQLQDSRFGLNLALDPVMLQKMVVSRQPLRLDEEALRTQIETWASQFAVPALDARLDFDPNTGAVTVLQASQIGRKLDVEATLTAIHDALATGGSTAALVMAEVAPAVDMNRVAEMGIRELVASGTSYFKGSAASRIRNIELGAEKFAGLVIPPGGIFSFNENVEDVSSANDFEDSLVIWGDRTDVGVGGGICQVSTTIFRAAYNAGLPIVERYNHGYIVSWYGEPGLDATIFTPTTDFRFRNDTAAYLLVEPVVDSVNGVITFNLYGTKPNRTVTIDEPVQSEIIEPEPPEYRLDETLEAGQIKQVEWQQTGMYVSVTRTIVENGTERTDTLTSKYRPWRAVYLYGPGTEIPESAIPTPTETISATETISGTTPMPTGPAEGP